MMISNEVKVSNIGEKLNNSLYDVFFTNFCRWKIPLIHMELLHFQLPYYPEKRTGIYLSKAVCYFTLLLNKTVIAYHLCL